MGRELTSGCIIFFLGSSDPIQFPELVTRETPLMAPPVEFALACAAKVSVWVDWAGAAEQFMVHLPFPGQVKPYFTALSWSERLHALLLLSLFGTPAPAKMHLVLGAQGTAAFSDLRLPFILLEALSGTDGKGKYRWQNRSCASVFRNVCFHWIYASPSPAFLGVDSL